MNHGFIKVASAIPEVKVADCEFNSFKIQKIIEQADSKGVEIICFPELSISAYTCADLFFQKTLLESAKKSLVNLVENTSTLNIICIVGLPLVLNDKLFNVAAVFAKGKILGFVPKTYLPNYYEFYEKRWFSSAKDAVNKELYLNTEDYSDGISKKPIESQFCEADRISKPESSIVNEDLTIDKSDEIDVERRKIEFVVSGQNPSSGNNYYPFTSKLIFGNDKVKFSIEICEDLWAPTPPSSGHCPAGAHLVFNLSASNELIGKHLYRKELIMQQSAKCMAGYIYSGSGWGESTTDIVFSGNAIIAENGAILNEAERFSFSEQLVIADIDVDRLKVNRAQNTSFHSINNDDYIFVHLDFHEKETEIHRRINPLPFVPQSGNANESLSDIFSIQVGGLAKRLMHTGIQKQVIGVSGGLDSTLALLVCAKTCDKLQLSRSNIIGVTMPGFGTSRRTYNNAIALMKALGVTIREINITKACLQHFEDINHNPEIHDITFENTQARERTQILMDIANQCNGLVVGTGDLSELALGWATYNGDHISMYAVNVSIPKTLVKHLVNWVATTQLEQNVRDTLNDISATPISPELLPASNSGEIAQSTETIVGPYELHDFFLYYLLRLGYSPTKIYFMAQIAFAGTYPSRVILKWMTVFYKRFFAQQFKRSCLPDGPKVGSVNLSPRGDWRMPSDASPALWLKELETLFNYEL